MDSEDERALAEFEEEYRAGKIMINFGNGNHNEENDKRKKSEVTAAPAAGRSNSPESITLSSSQDNSSSSSGGGSNRSSPVLGLPSGDQRTTVRSRRSSINSNIELDISVPSSPVPPRAKRLVFDPVFVVGGPNKSGQNVLLPTFKRMKNMPSTSTRESNQNSSLQEEESIVYDSDNESSTTASSSISNKKAYDLKEEQILMDYVIDHDYVRWAGGTILWTWLEEQKVFESFGNRTWQSLKNVFVRKIVPVLESKTRFNPYRISKKKMESFKNQRLKAKQNIRGQAFIPPRNAPRVKI